MHIARPNSQLSNHHLALLVDDLSKAETFYATLLGLQEEMRHYEEDQISLRSIWLRTGPNSRLMLEKSPSSASQPTTQRGWHLLALTIPACDRYQWKSYLESHGVPITNESSFSLYFEDPEGNQLALSHWPELAPEHNAS